MNKKSILESLLLRASLLQPETCTRVSTFLKGAIDGVDKPENQERLVALRKRAYEGDVQAFQELNSLRIITIDNFVTAQANALAFFNVVPLKADEQPYLRNTTRQEVKCRFIGEDGKPRTMQAAKLQSDTQLPLRMLSSDDIEFKIFDMYKGEIADDAKSQFDVAYDLSMKINAELWTLIKGQVGDNFNYTGSAKQARTLNLHSSIITANLPTGNLITLASNSNSTKFRFDVLRAIAQWCLQWGTSTLSTGEIVPVTVYVPSLHVGDMLDELTLGSVDNAMVQEIKDVGYVVSLGRKKFNIVGDATLDPAAYRCYVRTNQSLGDHFTKPAGDRMFPSTAGYSDAERKANKASMSAQKVYGAVAPEPNRLGVLGVQYRTV